MKGEKNREGMLWGPNNYSTKYPELREKEKEAWTWQGTLASNINYYVTCPRDLRIILHVIFCNSSMDGSFEEHNG